MSRTRFIFKNIFWDLFFQKLFSQLISIKLWVMLGSALLCIFGVITGTSMVTIWVTTLGVKGAYEIADVFKTAKDKEETVKDRKTSDPEEIVEDDTRPHRLFQQSEERSIQRMLKGV